MNKKVQMVLTVALALVVLTSSFTNSVRSEDVLLASVDYVDYKFSELSNRISQISSTGSSTTTTPTTADPNITLRVDNVEKQVGAIETNLDTMQGKSEFLDQVTRDLSDSAVWQIITVEPGIAIYASDTSELVLRSGNAVAIGNKYDEGLSDVTIGTDVKDGTDIAKDHLMIVPRGDGRGIMAVTQCYVMFKGLWYMQ